MSETELHTEEVVVGTITLIFALHSLVWAVIHAQKMYQDLYTTGRKCFDHRRNPPKMSKIYRAMSWITTIAIFGYSLAILGTAGIRNFSIHGSSCKLLTIFNPLFWQIGKSCMFLCYLLRLHQCYSRSAFGYGEKKLKCMAIFIVVLTFILLLAIFIGVLDGDLQYEDEDGQFPFACSYILSDAFAAVLALGILIFDIILTIGAVVAFLLPIKRLFKVLESANKSKQAGDTEKKHQKMLYAGYKYKVCVICACVTSLIWILLNLTGAFPHMVSILAGVDWTINIFCLMFMTAYYPDAKYYRRFCALCIHCCDREGVSYRSKPEEKLVKELEAEETTKDQSDITSQTGSAQTITITNQTATIAASIDTMDVVPEVAKQTGPALLADDAATKDP